MRSHGTSRILFAALSLLSLSAQSFDVVSIRPSGPYPPQGGVNSSLQGGPGTSDPTHVRWNFVWISNLINAAFGVRRYQVTAPGFINGDTWNIAATVSAGATKDQLGAMWRNLLIERFGMVARVEQKEFDAYELIVGPNGHKLVATSLDDTEPHEDAAQAAMKAVLETGKLPNVGLVEFMTAGRPAKLLARAQPTSAIAVHISNELQEPVFDRTGLTGKYDFEFEYTPRRIAARSRQDTGVDIVTAIEESLGLRLRKIKAPLDHVIVEKIERAPTEN